MSSHTNKLFLSLLMLLILLVQVLVFAESSSANGVHSLNVEEGDLVALYRKKHQSKINCPFACSRRCRKASRKNVCIRACNTCCFRCHCVPPGTYGNKHMCPCYASLKTHGHKPKCP